MNILFLSRWYPYPVDNGSKLRIYNILQGLTHNHEVILISFTDQQDIHPNDDILHSICQDVQVVVWKGFDPRSQKSIFGLLNSAPRSIVDTYSIDTENRIKQILSNEKIDLIIASQITSAGYANHFKGIPSIFEELELGIIYEKFAHTSSGVRRLRHGLTWKKYQSYLRNLVDKYDACTVVSEREKQLLKKAFPDYQSIEIIPNCVNLSEFIETSDRAEPETLIFTGSFRYDVNYDAMVWFLQDILPRIQKDIKNVSLTITGDHVNLPLPEVKNVPLTGFVEDVHPMIQSSWISLAPIRQGGGTRLKILEAMALRTPVVATSKGAEGLDLVDGEHILIADTAEAFSKAVIRLLRNSDLRQSIVDKAYCLVAQKYDWAVVMPKFLDLVERVASS